MNSAKNYGQFKVIVGGAEMDRDIEHFSYISGSITNTRLMGKVAMCFDMLIGAEPENSIYVYHIFTIDCVNRGIIGAATFFKQNNREIKKMQSTILGEMGGKLIDLKFQDAIALFNSFANINKRENIEFPGFYQDYKYLLEIKPIYDKKREAAVMDKICDYPKTPFSLVHNFLARLWAMDIPAAKHLADGDFNIPVPHTQKSMLMLVNNIKEHIENDRISYLCESILEEEAQSRLTLTQIRIAIVEDRLKIVSCDLINNMQISPLEVAFKTRKSQYITVFEFIIEDAKEIAKTITALSKEISIPIPNQYTDENNAVVMKFQNDGTDHLDKANYDIQEDVEYMVCIPTGALQLVVASYSVEIISELEAKIMAADTSGDMLQVGRFEFGEDVFYEFAQSGEPDFIEYLEAMYEDEDDD